MTAPLRIGAFGGGVVIEGTADQRRIDELSLADGVDLGNRGGITATTGPTDYVQLNDSATPAAAVSKLLGLVGVVLTEGPKLVAVSQGWGVPVGSAAGDTYLLTELDRAGSSSPLTPTAPFVGSISVFSGSGARVTPVAEGVQVTGATFAGLFPFRRYGGGATADFPLYLLNLGAREGSAPRTAPGLYLVGMGDPSNIFSPVPVGQVLALGTGTFAPGITGPGSEGQQLYFRGIVAYNNHVFGWGFDAADATSGQGPNRVMFCNLGDPTKWGNDNQAEEGTDRAFTDSDAVTLGDAGDIIRAALVWNGRLWFGTNKGLHFISGYGRESFLTNGSTPVMKAQNVLGPGCLLEGPDRMMYGVGDQGLWKFSGGGDTVTIFDKLRDQNGFSTGYWDLLWTDDAEPLGAYPGRTNTDLVWMVADWEMQQVIVGIPWCDAAAGYGPGEDTVLLKYHVRTGGFTRQVLEGVQYSAAAWLRREASAPEVKILGTATSGETTLQNYGYKATAGDSAVMPDPLPALSFGPYAVFGPEGHGVIPRAYLTLSWVDASALPLVFECVVTVDNVTVTAFTLTVGATEPVGASEGDVWLDTSQSSTDLGNGTAATGIAAAGGYLVYVRNDAAWRQVPGQGATGTRATIPIPLKRRMGTRVGVVLECTAASGRFTVEGLGFGHAEGVAAA